LPQKIIDPNAVLDVGEIAITILPNRVVPSGTYRIFANAALAI
jgi:hypothetical protein